MRRSLMFVLVAVVSTTLQAVPASASGPTVIRVMSTRADLVSGGDALVSITGTDLEGLVVRLNGDDVTGAFSAQGLGLLGVVTGMHLGSNTLTAQRPDDSGAVLDIVNHPSGGPIFAGPQIQPWVCQNGSPSPQCDQAPVFEYFYKPSGGTAAPQIAGPTGPVGGATFQPYDPSNPPADGSIASTTTDQGVTVPYIFREEIGYVDRDEYRIAALFDPHASWTATAPQPQWNHKVLITHGASCGTDHQTGTSPSVETDYALSRGFAVMSTAADNAGHNCNLVTEAESLVMAKEHLIDTYGTVRYTIGTGCSGGSLVQQQVANAYPGLYQGILPACSFPDAWSTGQQLMDYQILRDYFENPSRWSVPWTPSQIMAIEGHPNHANVVELSTLYFQSLANPSTGSCAGVPADQKYNAQTNRTGVRCTLADNMINVFGPSDQSPDGFAGRPLDNVGVQYGLKALLNSTITPDQFIDVNAKAGGYDLDINKTASRTAADTPAIANAYRSGTVNMGNNLKDVAIIDLRGIDPGAFHDVYRSFATRARLQKQNGTFANQVIWEGPIPLLGDAGFTTDGFVAMDRWQAAIEADHSAKPFSQKIIDDRPADVHDRCTNGTGTEIPNQTVCNAINPIFSTPRIEAGESIATDQNKCALKPLARTDYMPYVRFTDAQMDQLAQIFPSGVCNWDAKGDWEKPTTPWQTYQDAAGNVIYGGMGLGPVPQSVPFG